MVTLSCLVVAVHFQPRTHVPRFQTTPPLHQDFVRSSLCAVQTLRNKRTWTGGGKVVWQGCLAACLGSSASHARNIANGFPIEPEPCNMASILKRDGQT